MRFLKTSVLFPLTFLVLGAAGCSSSPRFEGLDAAALFALGEQAFEEGEWDDAIAPFERLVNSTPGFDRNPEARMYIARAYYEKEQFLTAAAEWEGFLLRFPSHGLAPEASLGICRAYVQVAPIAPRDQEYTRRARDSCRQTATDFQGMNVAVEADSLRSEMVNRLAERTYLEGRFYQRRGVHGAAVLVLQDLVDFFPETRWAPVGFLALYRSYQEMGWEEEMEEVRERLLFLYPDSDAAAELRTEMAPPGEPPSGLPAVPPSGPSRDDR